MFGFFERWVAFRYLRARRQEGFISVIALFSLLGIMLGVATLIIVMSVMNGFRHELLSRILGLNGHLTVATLDRPMTDYETLAQSLKSIDGVVLAVPTVEGQVMVTAHNQASGAIIRGVSAQDLKARPIIANNIVEGSLDNFQGEDAIAIGSRMARRFGLTINDSITLISPQGGSVTLIGGVPRIKAYKIVAIFEVGMFEYDSGFAFMPLEAAQVFFKQKGQVNNLEIFLTNVDQAGRVRREIQTRLGGNIDITDWQRSNAAFFNAIQVERNVMFLILTLIIIVAAFNIISGQIMLVKSKGRDIAILRTMGATRGGIMRIFLLSGASIGIIGTGLGFALGLGFADNIESIRQWLQSLTGTELFSAEIYFLSQLPAIVDPWEVVTVVAMALGISFLATLYPAWRAARLDPVEALRYE